MMMKMNPRTTGYFHFSVFCCLTATCLLLLFGVRSMADSSSTKEDTAESDGHLLDFTSSRPGTAAAVDDLLATATEKNEDGNVQTSMPKFGKHLRQSEFLLNYTNFNHGSFGACPKSVLAYQSALRLQQEQQPDVWFRRQYRLLINETRSKVAAYVGLSSSSSSLASSEDENQDADGLVLVESASTAVNSILRSFPFGAGDILVMFSVAYPMVKFTAQWLADQYQVQVVQVPVSFPITQQEGDDAFLKPMQQTLDQLASQGSLSRLRMVVLDHIVSTPAVKEPIQELAALIKSYQGDCFVLVDGAHVVGQVRSLDLTQLGGEGRNIDAYLSNGHKWLYSPKGSAFLWVNPTSGFVTDTFPEPTVISSTNPVDAGTSLQERYMYISTRDYTAFLSLNAAIDFRQVVLGGEDAVYDYCRNLALSAKHYLMELWEVQAMVPDEMEEFMINIGLPVGIDSIEMGKALMEHLQTQHGIYMLALYDGPSGRFYTRLSAQVYLELQDFQRLGILVLDFVNNHQQPTLSDA